MAPPVYPVPPPRAITVSPRSAHARTHSATSSSESGLSTTNGYSTRQSVASVTWETRAKPSKQTLSRRVTRVKRRSARLRKSRVVFELSLECIDRARRRVEQTRDLSRGILPPRLNLLQSMPHGFDEREASAWIVEQIILQVWIACDRPDVAEDFVQHACRAAGTTLLRSSFNDPRSLPQMRMTISRSEKRCSCTEFRAGVRSCGVEAMAGQRSIIHRRFARYVRAHAGLARARHPSNRGTSLSYRISTHGAFFIRHRGVHRVERLAGNVLIELRRIGAQQTDLGCSPGDLLIGIGCVQTACRGLHSG